MDNNFKQVLDSIKDQGIFLLDKEVNILFANEAACGITGYEVNELTGRSFFSIYADAEKYFRDLNYLLMQAKEKPLQHESIQVRKDGTTYRSCVHLYPVKDSNGKFQHFTAIINPVEVNLPEDDARDDEHYRILVESIQDYAIFMLDTEGYIKTWNEGAKKIKGYSSYEVIGKHFSLFYKKDEQDKPARELKIAIKTGKYEEEGWRVRKNGTVFWANILLTPMYNNENKLLGFAKITRDLTQKKSNEETLRLSEQQLRLLVNHIHGYGIVMLDENGKIKYWSDEAERLFGYQAKEVNGKSFSILYDSDDVSADKPTGHLKTAIEKTAISDEGWKRRKNGNRFWALLSLSSIVNEEKQVIGFTAIVSDYSERKEKENHLRESEQRYRLLIEGVKDYAIFMLDPTGHINSWNEGAKKIKGYSSYEVIGKHFSIFYTGEDKESNKPERELQIAVEFGKYEEEMWRVKKDGSLFWANVTITAIYDEQGKLMGFTKITKDLTERKKVEDTLKESEERYRLLTLQVKDYGIFMLDEKGHIISWNEGAKKIKGYQAEEVIGKHFSIFYTPVDIAIDKPAMELKVATETGKYEEEGWRVRKDGTRFWANVVITALFNDEKKLIGFSKVTRDLTERKEAEEALKGSEERHRFLAEELNKTNKELEYANGELEQFTSIVSHDLQEPLRTINSFLLLIETKLKEQASPQMLGYIEKAMNGSRRMKQMIINLLQYTQVNKEETNFQEVNATEIISEAVQNLKESIDTTHASVQIENEISEMRGDALQLVQLFQNLIGNALKFTGDKHPVVVIRGKKEKEQCHFSVADNGIGIDKENQDKIFELFKRLHTKAEYPGNGIGLPICKKIVDRHKGKIWIESEKGKGTTFHVTMNCN